MAAAGHNAEDEEDDEEEEGDDKCCLVSMQREGEAGSEKLGRTRKEADRSQEEEHKRRLR
jgi:hypothetical protein